LRVRRNQNVAVFNDDRVALQTGQRRRLDQAAVGERERPFMPWTNNASIAYRTLLERRAGMRAIR
jgi:hypothetical protein